MLRPVPVVAEGHTASLASIGDIEITNAAPEYAEALFNEIQACGGTARIVEAPQKAHIYLITEALAEKTSTERHYTALKAALSVGTEGRAILLDRASSKQLSNIGGASGLCRSIRIERPGVRVFSLSLGESSDLKTASARIVQSIGFEDGDYTLRGGDLYKDTLTAEVSPIALPGPFSDSKPIWLISGGARGVTSDCAIEIAKRTGGAFVLLGRSPITKWPEWLPPEYELKALRGLLARNSTRPGLPSKPKEIDQYTRMLLAGAEITETLQSIKRAGAHARYIQADIGDADRLGNVLKKVQAEVGQFTGLVHGAGVLADGLVEALRIQDFERVFEPKVSGLNNILNSLDTHSLKHIGLFSSASAVFGNQGQANYAAANAWLNNVAECLAERMPDTQVKAFCWGPWQGGMVDDALAHMFTERGISLISRPEGARIFADQLLFSPHDHVRFVIGDDWGGQ